jgi:hypothetical protein
MNQPDWIYNEAQRIQAERRLARIEAAIGAAVVAVWTVIIIEAIKGLVH